MLNYLQELFATGVLKTVIDRKYLMNQVAEASAYVDTGKKRGNVVITIEH